VQLIYARTYQTIPLVIVASIRYLIVTSAPSVGQYYLERYLARSTLRPLPPRQRLLPSPATPRSRLRAASTPVARLRR
jgi:hypothetical protein